MQTTNRALQQGFQKDATWGLYRYRTRALEERMTRLEADKASLLAEVYSMQEQHRRALTAEKEGRRNDLETLERELEDQVATGARFQGALNILTLILTLTLIAFKVL